MTSTFRHALIAAAALSIASCTTAPQDPADPQPIGNQSAETAFAPPKSPNDERDYRYLTLDNGLRVLLISEPEAEVSAASLTVFRGSYHEPDAYVGLAHFLEHMLFIGTEKYPELDGYQQFLGANGGNSNAYTAADHTNYFFDVKSDHFDEALDRFAQFFISPLLDPAYVNREKNAVHSEYQLQLKDDGWRGYTAVKQAYRAGHPAARFNIGSLDTLGAGIGEAMKTFFATQYSADQMALVVLGATPLDELEGSVRSRFRPIPNHNIGPPPSYGTLFDATGPRTLNVRTLKNEHKVAYNFLVPPLITHYDRKPGEYIANLLGHEGVGSLHAYLKSLGWIESLASAASRIDNENSIISVELQLTKAGAGAVDEITKTLFRYIDLLRREGITRWRWDEQAVASELAFRFQEKTTPLRTVYALAPQLMYIPPEDILTAPYRFETFDPTLIERYMAALTPANLLIEIAGPDVATDQTERFFGVEYALGSTPMESLSSDSQARLSELSLPEQNPFLPDDLALLENEVAQPQRIVDEPGLALWLATDTEFRTPRANQYFRIGVPGGLGTPEDYAFAALYSQLVMDSLNTWAYPAQLAGLNYRISNDPAGFRISIGGYDQKQATLLEEVLKAFAGLEIRPQKFNLYQSRLVKNWRNFEKERPYTQVSARTSQVVRSRSWQATILADALADKTAADLNRWRTRMLDAVAVEGLLHGNLNQRDAATIRNLVEGELNISQVAFEESVPRKLNGAEQHKVDIDHNDAAIAIYVQTPGRDYAARATTALLAETIQQSFFTELRTNQQLGYVVAARNRPQRNQPGLIFIIQSPVAGAGDLESAIETFLRGYRGQIAALPDAEFANYQQGLAVRLTEREKNLRQRSQRYWADLMLDDLSFDSQRRIADEVLTLNRSDLLAYYDLMLERFADKRLVVYAPGKFADGSAPVGSD